MNKSSYLGWIVGLGPSLLVAMADGAPGGLKDMLLEVSQLCKAVVACRVSPDQKRQMVHLVKTGVPGVRTLAIGSNLTCEALLVIYLIEFFLLLQLILLL